MKFRIAFLLVLFIDVAVGQGPGGAVEGVVFEQGTNAVVPRATLDLRALNNPNARYPAISTSEGKFTFRNVLPGTYSLVAARAGYLRAEHGQRGPYGTGTTFEVRAGQSTRDIRIGMIPNAALSGRVYDGKGPVMNAQIHAWRVSYAEGWRKLLPVTSAVTNDLGEYRVFGLPPGQYYLSAQPEPRSFVRSPSYASVVPPLPGIVVISNTSGGSGGITDPANNRLAGADYAPVYFGGATSEFSATPITVLAGDNLRGIDIPVDRIPMVSVIGTVTDSSTREPVRASITVTPLARNIAFTSLSTINVTGGVLSVTAQRPMATQGQFRTEPLPQGSYLITAVADVQGRRLAGQAIVDTRNPPDPSGIRVTVSPAYDIAGQVVFDGVPNAPNLKIGLISTASQPLDIAAVAPSASGSFTLSGVPPGNYIVQVAPFWSPTSGSVSVNAYVKSARLANSDVLSDGLQLERPPEGRLEIVIGSNPGRVAGQVSSADRQPLAGVMAVLVPEDRHRFDLYRSAMTNASGQVAFEGVPPGRYKVFAWEDVEKNAWWDTEFMSMYEDRGVAVAVDTGTSATAEVTAIPSR